MAQAAARDASAALLALPPPDAQALAANAMVHNDTDVHSRRGMRQSNPRARADEPALTRGRAGRRLKSMSPPSAPTLRVATPEDIPAISALIADSVRGLSKGFYTEAQAESALRFVFGVDSQLIADGSYFVIEDELGIAAAGGWSARLHLYGGDQAKGAEDPRVDPAREPARIRAFFVAPRAARQGMGRRLYEACVNAARDQGFKRLALVATMPGIPLYLALGFEMGEEYVLSLPDGVALPLAQMSRSI
jgi:GNAT superfamily N-acetyltransferase